MTCIIFGQAQARLLYLPYFYPRYHSTLPHGLTDDIMDSDNSSDEGADIGPSFTAKATVTTPANPSPEPGTDR